MGLFSGIKKFVKKIIKGVKKVFKPILKPIAKLFDSKLGKIILIGAAIFTAGMALYAGWAAASAANTTMFGKFLAGSKAFMSAIVNPIQAAKGAFQGTGIFAEGASLSGAGGLDVMGGSMFTDAGLKGIQAGQAATGDLAMGTGNYTPQTSASMSGGGPPAPGAGPQNFGGTMPAHTPAPVVDLSPGVTGGDTSLFGKSLGMLSEAAGKVGDFAQTTGGGLMLSKMVEGFSEGKALESIQKERDRRSALWADSPELDRLREVSQRRLRVPENWVGSQTDPDAFWQIRNQYGYAPSVPYSSGVG